MVDLKLSQKVSKVSITSNSQPILMQFSISTQCIIDSTPGERNPNFHSNIEADFETWKASFW